MLYPLIRKMMFRLEPEKAHHLSMSLLQYLCAVPLTRAVVKQTFQHQSPLLAKDVFGLHFANPVGLGAGFDKNALYLRELDALGFGSMEIGTVTPVGQPGNPPPRLFRLPQDKALINRMGFNNEGVEAVRQRVEKWRTGDGQSSQMVIGGNIGKNKLTPNEAAVADYVQCFDALFETVDYFVVNVSSPNTPGLRELQEKSALTRILGTLQERNQGKAKPKPLLLKIAPDLTESQLEDIVSIALDVQLAGIVATNTTISRDRLTTEKSEVAAIGAGGLSGKPVFDISTNVLKYLSLHLVPHNIPLIASGGIFTGEDATAKLQAGASLVQIWTGFIYEGPSVVKNICQKLVHGL